MEDLISRILHNLAGRLDGPMHIRFIFQPALSMFFAIRDGIHDSKRRGPAYLWALFTSAAGRKDLLRSGWKGVGRVFLLAMGLDAVYQIIALHTFYPGEALLTSFLLALLPYALLRGPVNRIAQRWTAGRQASHETHQE
jgi:hypothetical protein